MLRMINLRFFGGGGSTSVQEVEKREPKSEQLKAMDDAMYNVFGGLMNRYGGTSMTGITGGQVASSVGGSYDLSKIPGAWKGSDGSIMIPSSDPFGKAHRASISELEFLKSGGGSSSGGSVSNFNDGGWMSKALDTADNQMYKTNQNINQLLDDTPQMWEQYQELINNGTNQGFENYIKASEDSMARAYSKNVGTDLNTLSGKGIINSTVFNNALANRDAETADAIAKNRNTSYNTYSGNLLNGYNSGIASIKDQLNFIPSYYENALSPLMPSYQFWKDSTNTWLANDKDYIATQDSGS